MKTVTTSASSQHYRAISEIKTGKTFKIGVEGNIAAGKSTIVDHLSKLPFCQIVLEPVAKWQNMAGHNLLAMYYDDPNRWAFTFQVNALLDCAALQSQPSQATIKVMERSIYSARYCFIENLHRNGKLNDVEYKILDDLFQTVAAKEDCRLDLIIYLRSNPSTCMNRLESRNWSEEKHVELDYLTILHELHEQWLYSSKTNLKRKGMPPVVIVDAEKAKENVMEDILETISRLVKGETIPQ